MLKVSSTVDVTRAQPMYAIITRKMLAGMVPKKKDFTSLNSITRVFNYIKLNEYVSKNMLLTYIIYTNIEIKMMYYLK